MPDKKPQHIVCLALPAWEAEYLRSTVELMKSLSGHNLVLYVDYAYTVSDLIKGITGKKKFDWKRLIGLKNRLRKVSGDESNTGLYVLSLPPLFPAFILKSERLFRLANKFNSALSGYFINKAISRLQMQDIIGFNSFQPFLGRYWNISNISFNVYYIYDDFSKVPWFNGFAVSEERQYIAKTDLVIVTSAELKKRQKLLNKPVEIVNNGVHFDWFFKNRNVKRFNEGYIKTVGYTGVIDNRLDVDMLERVIEAMQNTRFLFVGKVADQSVYNRLIKYINVCFEPAVPASQVPVIQSQIHVGIIPYVCNELTAAIYPLKVNEYLAMGLPVVMTPFASLNDCADVVYIANGYQNFKHCLELALLENDVALQEKRIGIAQKADWQERADQLLDLINEYKNHQSLLKKPIKA
ncbi:glycosyltransferase [Mucilaginibacter celer]|uniref:Glycosyltransferase n=1 Tax=Mucilaginibacter celer TaxID=2305508 RepID=A0A494VN69_9SPHI|nr:glycosyltransferase [Mucilaginibacter celer]AYL95161.1 glycosyltransferase [Mucilaginibacter celer]